MRSGIIGLQGVTSSRLRVTHFFKGSDERNSLLAIEKESTSFGFGCGGRNTTNGFAENMDGAVGLGIRRIGGGAVT